MAGFRPVGALETLRPGIGPAELVAAAALLDATGPAGLPVVSPWAGPANLESVVISDVFGALPFVPLTRAEAIRVPAVARARHILCGTIARIPLRGYRGDELLEGAAAPSWLEQTDALVSTTHRMLWTIDDLLFYGWSLWRITQRAIVDGRAEGFPLRMDRVPMDQWRLERDTGRVLIYKPDPLHPGAAWTLQPATAREVVLIPGPHEGLLVEGAPAVRHARDLQKAAHNAARFPSAYLGLKQTSGATLKRRSDDETEVTVETVLADWREARRNPDGGGVAWLGGVDPVELGSFAAHLNPEGRNAAAVDVARHVSLPADLIDATISDSSLHYSTSRDNDRRGIDYGMGLYMSCVSAQLSMDAVTPRGQRVAFDLEEWLEGAAPAPGQPVAVPAGTGSAPAPAGVIPPQTGETPQ